SALHADGVTRDGGNVFRAAADALPAIECNPISSLAALLMAAFSTAQNFRDNTQANLPSYRERIVQVRLAKTEGGLNLDMPAETLKELAAKGEAAGELLLPAGASNPDGFNLAHHQWV